MHFFGKIKGVFYILLKTKELFLKYVKHNGGENQIDIQGMPNPCSRNKRMHMVWKNPVFKDVFKENWTPGFGQMRQNGGEKPGEVVYFL